MKDPRTWNRRDFAVTANGFFTVLRPTGWFSTLRLPGGFRYLTGQSKGTTSPLPPYPTDNHPTALPLQFVSLGVQDRRVMRPALIVLAAGAITLFMLWWIMAGAPHIPHAH
jgi:hypothetical protein